MAVERVGAQSIGPTGSLGSVNAIQSAHDLQINNSSFSVVGGDSHTHTNIHYHGSKKDLQSLLDAISNFRKIQQDTLAKATPGTIVWLLECEEFRLFIDVDGVLKILWGSGMPGAGKTILASIVIARLEALAKASNGKICVGYVYIRYSDQDHVTIRGILEVLVKQTIERHPECLPLCEQTYSRHLKEGTQPTEEELVALLRQFSQRFKGTFYVLDALDEAPVRIRPKILQKLSSFGARLFITSRPLPALESKFPAAHTFPIQAQDEDVDLHIAEKILESEDLQDLLDRGGPEFKERLVAIVKERCGGMFLHASLQLDALQDCFTTHDALRTLEAFPRKIEDVYRQTWSRIICSDSSHHASLAKSAFAWVLNAKQSMTIDLLRHALATCPETYRYDAARLMPEATILAVCRGLITVDKESELARLVHYTAKDPLEHLLSNAFSHPHALLAAVCITRLMDCKFQTTTFTSWQELDEALFADPLVDYAHEAWGFHAQKCIHLDPTVSLVSTFVAGCSRFPILPITHSFTIDFLKPLHMAAFYGLPIPLADSQATHNPNIPTPHGKLTPLHLACIKGHQASAQSLLRLPGVLVNARDSYERTPLMMACECGHEGIVALFLACPDIEINAPGVSGSTVLTFASHHGRASIVKLLLTHPDINANLPDHFGLTPLMVAAMHGFTSVVEILLSVPCVNVNAVDEDGDTAILMAAEGGHEDIIRILLDVPGIDISLVGTSESGGCHTPMSIAVEKGHDGIVQLLQDFEAKRDSR